MNSNAKVYYNGKVYTGNGGFAEAFAVEDGSFCSVGTNAAVLEHFPNTEKVDLCGRFVCAGFNDSHMHLVNYAQALMSAPLMAHTSSLNEVLVCMKRQLELYPPTNGGWLKGRGWNQDYFTDTDRMPNRRDLDEVSEEVPIIITRACGHCCVVNSKALEIAGITKATVSPEGGFVGKTNGEPDGRLYDNAMDLVLDSITPPDREGLKRMIKTACRALNSYGITSAQTDDYCVFRTVPFDEINAAYRELEMERELTVRVSEQCNFTDPKELEAFISEGNITGRGGDMFKIGPLKLLGDGSLGSRTAHLTVQYIGGGGTGFSLMERAKLFELVDIAHSAGMQIAVHAIGDACLDTVLDAFEEALNRNPRIDHRHGIVHCQITRRDQLQRMTDMRLHIYAQSVFLDYDNHIVNKLVEKELADTSYNWKTLLDGGLYISNGSDCPVEPPDVLKGVECAITRTSLDGTGPYLPEQAFSVAEALDSFTVSGARASFDENIKGRIKNGQLADFVVLDASPFDVPASNIHLIKVIKTYLGGECVFER
ncbi:MAG: amidohydrolase [Clostridia bacterium]|nr:amidohydrolase [Clostridia bacterium]